MMNQNVYPAQSEDVLAALPIQATRVLMNGNHTAFFNLETAAAVPTNSLPELWRPNVEPQQ